jgi:CheY-like chemotaxis protein
VVELTFSGEDIDVVTVSDGEQAIARILVDRPDIVLADIAMPKKNGYEVAAFVKEHPSLSNVPVLLLAGAFEPVDEEHARRVKSDGVLVKPFETHELIGRVRELIDVDRRESRPAPAPAASTSTTAVPVPPAPVAPPPAPPREEPPAPSPAPAEESLDAYFDRLDVAFAARAQNPPRPFPHLAPPSAERIETSAPGPVAVPDAVPEGRSVLADLFHTLFEVEQGERDPDSIRIPDAIERIRRGHRIE